MELSPQSKCTCPRQTFDLRHEKLRSVTLIATSCYLQEALERDLLSGYSMSLLRNRRGRIHYSEDVIAVQVADIKRTTYHHVF